MCCVHQRWEVTAKVTAKCAGQVCLPRSDGSRRTDYHLASEWHKWKQLPTVFISLGFVSLYRTNVGSLFKEELSLPDGDRAVILEISFLGYPIGRRGEPHFLWETIPLKVATGRISEDTVGLRICSRALVPRGRQKSRGWKCRGNKWKLHEAVSVQWCMMSFLTPTKAAPLRHTSLWLWLCIPAFQICVLLWKFEPSWGCLDCTLNKEFTSSWLIGSGIKVTNDFKLVSFWREVLECSVGFFCFVGWLGFFAWISCELGS